MKIPLGLLVIFLIALIVGIVWLTLNYQFSGLEKFFPPDLLQKLKELL